MYHVTKYQDDRPHYDEILSAIGEYFELFKTHTELLEDMWLQILSYLKLNIPTPCTVFRKIHYQNYIKHVISNPQLKTLIEEGVQAYNQQLGSD